jgi:DNA repair protein RadC
MLESLDTSLEAIGLTVTEHSPPSGETVYTVKGDTHPHRHLFRELGGDWDRVKQAWIFTGSDPRKAVVDGLREATRASGLSDVDQTRLPNKPHYWGHRQRLRDRFLKGPDEALPDYELLELLLFFSIERIDTKPLAKDLLARFESPAGVVNAQPDQLEEFDKINHYTITLFKAVRAMASRITREELSERAVLDNWEKLIAYLRASMAHRMVEQFRVLFFDRMNVLIADEVQHQGTIDHTPVYPREVLKRALALDASALVMVHNHPSNHPKPSKADIAMTKEVKEIVEKVGMVLHDHLIISKSGHSSFRQMGLL